MNKDEPCVVAVMGPTAVGKSQLVLDLALAIGAEIINADSMQVYRYLDIGTAKPTAAELAVVPHHLLDVVDPDQEFDAFRYRELAREIIVKLARQRRPAVVVGGTGLYLKGLLHGLFPGAPGNRRLRQRLRQEAEEKGSAHLYQRLAEVDPVTARRVHPRDLVRITRALEVWEYTGRPVSVLHREHDFREKPFQTLKIGLQRARPQLYGRINRRVDEMMTRGYLQEVKELLERGYDPHLKSMQALGYRHLVRHLRDQVPLSQTVKAMKRDTRRYAKRQITWFQKDPEIHWFHADEREDIIRTARQFLDEAFAMNRRLCLEEVR
jgi:tRNA dimethylallyltransferase